MVRGVGLMSPHGFAGVTGTRLRYDKDNTVQRPDIQAFVGALQGAQTTGGVFVTTGRFSSGALQFADNVAMRLRLRVECDAARLEKRRPSIDVVGRPHDQPEMIERAGPFHTARRTMQRQVVDT